MSFRQLNLSSTHLCGVWGGWNGEQKPIDYRGEHGTYTAEGVTAIADALRVNSALASVKLRDNHLGDEGWGAIFAAICGNKDSKIMSMDASSEHIGPAGVKLIAEALRTSVTGALTSINLSENRLCGIWNDDHGNEKGTYTAEGITAIADALRVNGALTSIDLSINQLCGTGTDYQGNEQGTYTAEGIKAIADALRVNGALTALNLSSNDIGSHWDYDQDEIVSTPEGPKAIADALLVNGALTECDLIGNYMGEEGEASIRNAVQGKDGFKLHL